MSTQATLDLPDLFLDSLIAPEFILPADPSSPEFLPLTLLEKPAPRGSSETSIDAQVNPAPLFLCSFPSSSSFASSTAADNNSGFSFDNNCLSPYSDLSDVKSSSSPRWRNRDTDKRAKHLERNRAAASKSRRKKKRETDQLQNQFQEVSRRKSRLEDEVKDLKSQLLSLKDQILMHSRCNDEAIYIYLGRIVEQVTRYNSFSCALTDETDGEDDRRHRMGLAPRRMRWQASAGIDATLPITHLNWTSGFET
ncbi:hypothetical protein BJX63DRAFT_425134 [Aspergillus granulosus]|uniref:BZIP domain-containing protein n=1 Tax=Aspergillus granulosus TaxID=176169 RepID=A0ABR4GX86_9EURO